MMTITSITAKFRMRELLQNSFIILMDYCLPLPKPGEVPSISCYCSLKLNRAELFIYLYKTLVKNVDPT